MELQRERLKKIMFKTRKKLHKITVLVICHRAKSKQLNRRTNFNSHVNHVNLVKHFELNHGAII